MLGTGRSWSIDGGAQDGDLVVAHGEATVQSAVNGRQARTASTGSNRAGDHHRRLDAEFRADDRGRDRGAEGDAEATTLSNRPEHTGRDVVGDEADREGEDRGCRSPRSPRRRRRSARRRGPCSVPAPDDRDRNTPEDECDREPGAQVSAAAEPGKNPSEPSRPPTRPPPREARPPPDRPGRGPRGEHDREDVQRTPHVGLGEAEAEDPAADRGEPTPCAARRPLLGHEVGPFNRRGQGGCVVADPEEEGRGQESSTRPAPRRRRPTGCSRPGARRPRPARPGWPRPRAGRGPRWPR